jgi:lipopolysaccharide/colanic/teichoic acid biosynthesis glycosyltransferase
MLASLGSASANGKRIEWPESMICDLKASIRETDVIGWYRQDEILATVFSELGTSEKDFALASLKNKVSALLREKSGVGTAGQVNLSFHSFPDDNGHSAAWLSRELHRNQNSRAVARATKRVIDVIGSLLGLVIFSPLLLGISLLVKLTSAGPILFRQTRLGQCGKEFTFFKFRSMYVNSDDKVHKEYVRRFIAGKAALKESADRKSKGYKVIDDPRVTPLGRLLRKTSTDELPQLLNVLKGDMSLVGPRPPLPYECACYDLWHRRRIVEVKPGITGLWQVHGRSKTNFDDMVRLDLRYANKWSLALDFLILLRTLPAVLSGAGAY